MSSLLTTHNRKVVIALVALLLILLVWFANSLYTLISENRGNPFTYEWGKATEMYLSRDGQVVVPRTIIDLRKKDGHYYGLRMSVDKYKCNGDSENRFTNRRWYFILPFNEGDVMEFSDRKEFEAELKKRIPNVLDELDEYYYSLFDEKWEYYSAIYEKRQESDCVIEKGL